MLKLSTVQTNKKTPHLYSVSSRGIHKKRLWDCGRKEEKQNRSFTKSNLGGKTLKCCKDFNFNQKKNNISNRWSKIFNLAHATTSVIFSNIFSEKLFMFLSDSSRYSWITGVACVGDDLQKASEQWGRPGSSLRSDRWKCNDWYSPTHTCFWMHLQSQQHMNIHRAAVSTALSVICSCTSLS